VKRTATVTETSATAVPSTATAAMSTTPADRTRGHIVRVFAERVRAALAFDLESGDDITIDSQGMPYSGSMVHDVFIRWGYDPRAPESVQETAEIWADHVMHVVAQFNVPARIRSAVALRLAEQWPWNDPPPSVANLPLEWTGDEPSYRRAMWRADHHSTLSTAEYLMERAKIIPPRVMWPSNISFDDVVATLERSTHPDARTVAQSCRDGRWSITLGGEATGLGVLRPGVWQLREDVNEYVPDPERKGWLRLADAPLTAALGTFFHPFSAALVAWAEKTHTEAHRRAAPFAYPSTSVARAATAHLSAPARGSGDGSLKGRAWQRRDGAVFLRLAWDGRIAPMQLSLDLDGAADLSAGVLAALVNELADDGMLDWLVLHMIAEAQGRTGAMHWTWEEHKRLAGYGHRVSDRHRMVDTHGDIGDDGAQVRATDELLRRRTIRRLWQLSRAALWEEGPDGKRGAKPLVDAFVHIEAIGQRHGLRNADDFTDARIIVHPLLYQGAHRDARGRDAHFTGLPRGVAEMSPNARRLLVFLLLAERYARDNGMRVSIPEHKALQLAGVRGDGKPGRRDITRARAEHARHYDEARDVAGDGASWSVRETPTGRVYDWTPARWRVEREVLGVMPPKALPRPSDAPTTGAGLRAWREARGLSQSAAAAALGVGVATVKRAELRPGEKLPRSFVAADWNAGRAPRQLGGG